MRHHPLFGCLTCIIILALCWLGVDVWETINDTGRRDAVPFLVSGGLFLLASMVFYTMRREENEGA